ALPISHAFIFTSSSPRAHPLPRRFFEGALIQLPHTGRARDGVLHPHRDLRRGEPGEPQRRGALDVRGETLPPQARITRRHPRVGDCFPPCADADEEPLVGNRDLRRPPLPRAPGDGVPGGGGPGQSRSPLYAPSKITTSATLAAYTSGSARIPRVHLTRRFVVAPGMVHHVTLPAPAATRGRPAFWNHPALATRAAYPVRVSSQQWVVTLSCPDTPGIVSAVSTAIATRGGNIT